MSVMASSRLANSKSTSGICMGDVFPDSDSTGTENRIDVHKNMYSERADTGTWAIKSVSQLKKILSWGQCKYVETEEDSRRSSCPMGQILVPSEISANPIVFQFLGLFQVTNGVQPQCVFRKLVIFFCTEIYERNIFFQEEHKGMKDEIVKYNRVQ